MKKYVAITSCSTGIAHTYMAAEALLIAAKEMNVEIKVETQGSIGAEDVLTEKDIREADAVIIAASTSVNKDRFIGKKVIEVNVDEAIKDPKGLIERAEKLQTIYKVSGVTTDEETQKIFKNAVQEIKPIIEYARMRGVKVSLSPALEDNFTDQAFNQSIKLIREVIPKSLKVKLFRSPCPTCQTSRPSPARAAPSRPSAARSGSAWSRRRARRPTWWPRSRRRRAGHCGIRRSRRRWKPRAWSPPHRRRPRSRHSCRKTWRAGPRSSRTPAHAPSEAQRRGRRLIAAAGAAAPPSNTRLQLADGAEHLHRRVAGTEGKALRGAPLRLGFLHRRLEFRRRCAPRQQVVQRGDLGFRVLHCLSNLFLQYFLILLLNYLLCIFSFCFLK